MAELTTLARPYAKAAFEVARESDELQKWQDSLAVASAITQETTVSELLNSPTLTDKVKAAQFSALCGESVSEKFKNFIATLAENKRLVLLPEINTLFTQYKANIEKSVDVDVVTAVALSSKLEGELKENLVKKLEREVSIQTSIDESLLGGALIRAGDTVIDGSVRGRLAKLAEAMNA